MRRIIAQKVYKFKPEDDEMQSQAYMHCQGYC